jgi:hypothetical protein
MKILLALALAIPLIADDAQPLATVEQLQAKVAEQKQEIALLKKADEGRVEMLAYMQRKLQMYQQGLFQCQDAQIDAQAKAKQEKK